MSKGWISKLILEDSEPWLVKTAIESASICKPFLVNLKAGYLLGTHLNRCSLHVFYTIHFWNLFSTNSIRCIINFHRCLNKHFYFGWIPLNGFHFWKTKILADFFQFGLKIWHIKTSSSKGCWSWNFSMKTRSNEDFNLFKRIYNMSHIWLKSKCSSLGWA